MKSSRLNTISFPKRNAQIIIFLSLSFFFAFLVPADISNQFKHVVALPLVPFQKLTTIAVSNLSGFWGSLFASKNLKNENKKLRQDVSTLKNLVIKQADIIYKLKNEIRGLSDFYDMDSISVKPVIANVIGYDTLGFRKSILLDAGSKHGIAIDDTVVSGNALVGRVFSVSKYTSRVQLITDPDIRIPARILETRDQGIVTGNSSSVCQMEYVPDTASVKEGNRIVTSGVGETYLSSLYIGKVTKSEKIEGQLFLNISVRPIVNVSKLESVLVNRHKSVIRDR